MAKSTVLTPQLIPMPRSLRIPPVLQPWLTDTGSLTAKLEKLSSKKLGVQPIYEGMGQLTMAEKRRLALPSYPPRLAWVRESQLYGSDELPWVYARSLFPWQSLVGKARQLTQLGKKPIGYVMFGRNGARLVSREIILTTMGWQRSSVYLWQGKKLLISETFLPTFLTYLNESTQSSPNVTNLQD